MDKENIRIDSFVFRRSICNALNFAGITTLGELSQCRETYVRNILFSNDDFEHLKIKLQEKNEQMRGPKILENETRIPRGVFTDNVYNSLKNYGVYTLEDIVQLGTKGLMCIHTIDKYEIGEIKAKLSQMGYKQYKDISNDEIKQFKIEKLNRNKKMGEVMKKDYENVKIKDLNIRLGVEPKLKRAGIETLGQLSKLRESMVRELLIDDVGLNILKRKIADYNIYLRGDAVEENETLITKDMFATSAYNALTRYGHINVTIEDILNLGSKGLLCLRRFGKSRLADVEEGLAKLGLSLEHNVEKKEETVETKDKKLYKQLVHGGIIETLEKLPCDVFQKGTPEMEAIIECVTQRLNEVSAEKTKVAKTNDDYKDVEAYIDNLMHDYMALVQNKRDEYEKMQNDARFGEKMGKKIDELKKFHHTNFEKKEGHNHNPYYNEESEL